MSGARNLQRKLERQQRELEQQKQALREERRQFDQAKKQLANDKKRFKAEQNRTRDEAATTRRQMKKTQSRLAASASPASPRVSRANQDPAKLKRDLDEAKKQVRTLRQEGESQKHEIKVLKKRLKRAGRGAKQVKPNKRIKQLEREAKVMRRKLKLALMDTEKTGAYYRKMLQRFKNGQEQWLREQRANARKGTIIKYVFVEEMKRIHVRRGRNAVRIVNHENDEAVMKNVEVVFEGEEAVTQEERDAAAADADNYEDIVEMVDNAELEDEVDEDEDDDDDGDEDDGEDEVTGVGQMGKQLIAMLYSELTNRIGDLEKFEEITLLPHDDDFDVEASLQTLVAGIQFRQADIEENFLQVITPAPEEKDEEDDEDGGDEEKATEDDDEKEPEEMEPAQPNGEHLEWHESLISNNQEWRDTLLRTRTSANTTVHIQKELMKELEKRIADVDELMKIMSGEHIQHQDEDDEKKDGFLSLDTIDEDEDEGTHVEKLVEAVAQRHSNALSNLQQKVSNIATEKTAYDDDEEPDEIRSARPQIWSNLLGKIRDGNDGWRTILLHGQHIEERQTNAMQTALETSNKMWWLRKDSDRNRLIDSMNMGGDGGFEDPMLMELLGEIGVFVNRSMSLTGTALPISIRNLYVPIVFDRPVAEIGNIGRNVMATLFDGVLLSVLLHTIRPDILDLRAIHYPDLQDPYPLSNTQVRENMSTVISTCKAIGIHGGAHWKVKDFCGDGAREHAVELFVEMVNALFDKMIDSMINIQKIPELVRLEESKMSDDEAVDQLKSIDGATWIAKWTSDKLGGNDTGEFLPDLCSVLSVISSENNSVFDGDGAQSLDIESCAEMVFDQILNGLNFHQITSIPQDIIEDNRFLTRLTTAELMAAFHGLQPLSKDEKKTVMKKVKAQGDDATMAWINSMMDDIHVNNLTRDVADGIVLLKLIDAAKPGCVNWKSVRTAVRHKFDRVNNCNYAVELCKDSLQMVLVGIGGTDLVDGNQKYIRTLLWQIMRYHSVKVLSDLQFAGQDVTDDDILNWANEKVESLGSMDARYDIENTPLPTSFKDRNLSNGIFFLDLINAVNPDSVDWNMVHDIPNVPGGRQRKKDAYENERLANARYVMTVIRRMGGELFVMPEDLASLEQRAVMSVLAAIMTIDARMESDPEYIPPTPRVDHVGKTRKSNAFLFGHLPGLNLDVGSNGSHSRSGSNLSLGRKSGESPGPMRGTHGRNLSRTHQRMNSLKESLSNGARERALSNPPDKPLPPNPVSPS